MRKELALLCQSPKETIEEKAIESSSRLITALRQYPVETCIVHFPVFGLEIFPDSFEINVGNVVIYSLKSFPKETESNRWFRYYLAEEASANAGLTEKPLDQESVCWAKAIVQANKHDLNRIHLEGARLVRESLALLALFFFACPDRDYPKSIYVDREPLLDIGNIELVQREICVIEDSINGKPHPGVVETISRKAEPYLINDRVIDAFRTKGFHDCAEVLRKKTLNPLDVRIRKALDYFSYGMQARNIFQRYVTYIAGLEALLLSEHDRRGAGKKISKRASYLLRDEPKKRKEFASLVDWLYGLRCDIVHGELPSAVEVESGLMYLRRVLYSLLKRLVTGAERFATVDDIVQFMRQ